MRHLGRTVSYQISNIWNKLLEKVSETGYMRVQGRSRAIVSDEREKAGEQGRKS